jgi:hypothetical protein
MVGNVREKTEPTPGSHGASATSGAATGVTLPARIMAFLLAGARAVSAPLRVPGQRGSDQAGPAAGMHNYKFQAVVAVIPSREAAMPPGPDRPGPDWHGVIRARSGLGRSHGMFSALVTDWAQAGPLGADAREPHAVATIVAFGPEPAESLPVGGTFALWRGRDVGLGVVTRRVYVSS